MRLEELVPQGSEFHLAIPNKTYHLRPCTLADEVWLQKTFGAKLESVFNELKTKELCRIAVYLMDDKEKEDFIKRTVTFIDDSGEKLSTELGGYELLMTLISGIKEKKEVCQAILQTVGLNRPVLEKLELEQAEKKSQLSQRLTGGQSLTSSVQSMDGVPSTSGVEP